MSEGGAIFFGLTQYSGSYRQDPIPSAGREKECHVFILLHDLLSPALFSFHIAQLLKASS